MRSKTMATSSSSEAIAARRKVAELHRKKRREQNAPDPSENLVALAKARQAEAALKQETVDNNASLVIQQQQAEIQRLQYRTIPACLAPILSCSYPQSADV
eukprot:m.251494 g.251494  ORF g.251494 m.251494 type:complete len:101 (+) comp17521_c0_seq23:193-495(+)